MGAALDRNGLRPLRYAVCEDGFVAAGSYARWAADGLYDISRGEPVVVTPDAEELERRIEATSAGRVSSPG